jgi:hypothetical protein
MVSSPSEDKRDSADISEDFQAPAEAGQRPVPWSCPDMANTEEGGSMVKVTGFSEWQKNQKASFTSCALGTVGMKVRVDWP